METGGGNKCVATMNCADAQPQILTTCYSKLLGEDFSTLSNNQDQTLLSLNNFVVYRFGNPKVAARIAIDLQCWYTVKLK